MAHARMWSWCWGLVTAAGFSAALFLRGITAVGWTWAVTACLSGLLLLGVSTPHDHSPRAALQRGRLVGRAVLIGAGTVAILVFATAVPMLAATLIILAVTSSPWAHRRIRAYALSDARPPARGDAKGGSLPVAGQVGRSPVVTPELSRGPVQELTDEELCHEWRKSFVVLERAQFQSELARVAALRRLLMDEVERRNPSALKAWLDSGARAAGGPDRYLRAARRRAGHSTRQAGDSGVAKPVDTNPVKDEGTP